MRCEGELRKRWDDSACRWVLCRIPHQVDATSLPNIEAHGLQATKGSAGSWRNRCQMMLYAEGCKDEDFGGII
jgi:hypothetical protein